MPNLQSQLNRINRETDKAISLVDNMSNIQNTNQLFSHYIAELILLRSFSLLESVIQEIACRLVCGASYRDGSNPNLLRPRPTHGASRALDAMKSFDRPTPLRQLRWTQASSIAENLEKLFPQSEHFTLTILNHGGTISDMRKVRNRIAHQNQSSYHKFQEVVRRRYGANVPSMTPGRMLISSRFSPLLLREWILSTRTILKTAARG